MSGGVAKRKLIEVAPFLPLDAISTASKADKDKKTGTIKNVHKWFAPMPAPAMRALIFAALVDAPDDEIERARLLKLVERLVPPDGEPPDKAVLAEAMKEIRRSANGTLPAIFDPFCGGGSTLIEAQRLGLQALGSDLNPVPVLITRTLTELLPKVAGRPPLGRGRDQLESVAGGAFDGVFIDVLRYATQVRDAAFSRIGHLYPSGPKGQRSLAWLWCWTAKCPNPACRATMPLVSSLWLTKKKGATRALVAGVVDGVISFSIGSTPQPSSGSVTKAGAICLSCGTTTKLSGIRSYAAEEGLGRQLLCAVIEEDGGRSFISADTLPPEPTDASELDIALPARALGFRVQAYGMQSQRDLYLPRQLAMLEAFADGIADVAQEIQDDGADELYAKTISSILGLALGKLAQAHSTQARWYIDKRNGSATVQAAFSRHALPMVWDFVELNPFAEKAVGNWLGIIDSIRQGVMKLPKSNVTPAVVEVGDARAAATRVASPVVIVTDPPYFNQIGYADLSDYFYVWHRRALRLVHPDLYGTIVTPKDAELIATPFRHSGSVEEAARYFIEGFTQTFRSLKSVALAEHPILIVYAHRQEESSAVGSASTGWDAMLEAVLAAGLTIEGTLPIRGASSTRQIGQGTNALASYVVMVCRPRSGVSSPATIADFRTALRKRLPASVNALLGTGESMIDIRQAAIGPGMEVFSQYSQVFDGKDPIRVRRALTIINEELGRLLDEHLGLVDDETRWACQWYADHGFDLGEYDEGRKLAAVYGLGVDGLKEVGIVEQGRGKVRLLPREDLPADWNGYGRTPLWEACQHLVKRLSDGEEATAALFALLDSKAGGVRELAQFLTNLAIEKGWSEEAIAYDALVKSWPRIEQLAGRAYSDESRLFEVGDGS